MTLKEMADRAVAARDALEMAPAERDEARAQLAAAQAEVVELRRAIRYINTAVTEDALGPALKKLESVLSAPTCAQPLLDAVAKAASALGQMGSGALWDSFGRINDALEALAPWVRR